MNGNEDFFGGSINPAPIPNQGTMRETNVYAPPGSPVAAVRPTSGPTISVILIVVGTLVAVAAFLGYRALSSGTDIVLPDELLGMERVDPDSKQGQIAEGTESGFETDFQTHVGEGVQVYVGTYRARAESIIVVAAEAGERREAEQDEYFAWFSRGFGNGSTSIFNPIEVEAGPKGGRMQCVNSPSSEDTGGGCAWITEDTLGVVILNSSEADLAEATRTVRAAIEQ